MLNDTDIGGLDKFLASSGKDAFPRVQEHDNILVAGATLGSWRVEAFLGRGGSGEVYRVVHSVTQTPAAAKVLTRDDEVTRKRFQDETDFLAQNQLPQFPRYFESGECNVFVRPMQLKPNHEYWVVGPGILDASVTSAGTNTIIRLKNCVFLNRSPVPFKNTGIRYIFQGGAYLNFTNMDRPEDLTTRQFEGYDGAFDEIRFKGPETIKGLNELRNKESWEMLKKDVSNHYVCPDKTFFIFRAIFCARNLSILWRAWERKTQRQSRTMRVLTFTSTPTASERMRKYSCLRMSFQSQEKKHGELSRKRGLDARHEDSREISSI